MGILTKIIQWLPGIGGILEKIGGNGKVEEIRARLEREDLEGFHRTGRISAAHLWKYAKVCIAMLLAVAFCCMLFYPEAARNAALLLDGFVEAVGKLFSLGM